MADDWDQDTPVSGQQPDQNFNWGQDAPVQAQAGSEWERDKAVDTSNDPRNPYGASTQPSTTSLGVAAREFARGVLPTAAGAVAGIGAGLLTSEATPFVSIPVGLATGAVVGGATRELQNKITDTLGLDSPESRERDVAEHPTAATVGGLAPAAVTFQPGAISTTIAQRLGSAAIMGGVDIGQQAIEKGISNIDPTEAGLAAGTGLVLPQPRGYISRAAGGIAGALGARGAPTHGAGVSTGDVAADPSIRAATDALQPAEPAAPEPVANERAPVEAPLPPEEITPQPRAKTPLQDLPFAEEAEPLEGTYEEITPRQRAIETSQTRSQPEPEPEGSTPQAKSLQEATPTENEAIAAMKPRQPSFEPGAPEPQAMARRRMPQGPIPTTIPKTLAEAADNLAKLTGDKVQEHPAKTQEAIDAADNNLLRVPLRYRNAFENYINNTWLGKAAAASGVDQAARTAAFDIRTQRGPIHRMMDQWDAALPQETKDFVSALKPEQQKDITAALFGDKTKINTFPELEPAVAKMKASLQNDMDFMSKHSSLDPKQFQERIFPNMFEDANKARDFYEHRLEDTGTVPTIADGIAAGLPLIYNNPIAAATAVKRSMYNYQLLNSIVDTGLKRKMISPQYSEMTNTKLEAKGLNGRTLYAPEGYANVFNKAFSEGWRDTPGGRQFMDLAQPTTNWGTGVLLGMSAFHPFTMLNEGFINQVALGAQQLSRNPGEALKTMALSPAGALKIYKSGLGVAKEWLQPGTMGPELTKTVERLEQANGRAIGHSDPTYQFNKPSSVRATPAEGLWQSFANSLKQTKNDIATNFKDAGGNPIQLGKATLQGVGSIMQSISHPLFQHIIPIMKSGAFRENFGEWMKQNKNADEGAQVDAAQKIWDDIENRFGLMTHDNVFINQKLKEGLQLGMTSFTWTGGFGRNVGGGVTQGLMHPSRFSMKSDTYDPRLGSTIALGVTVAVMSAAYQYLKTGEPPKDVYDLLAGRTGGRTPNGQPERAILPGFQKDIYGWLHDPLGEAQNKLGVVPKTMLETVTNKGWEQTPKGPRYGMIRNPNHSIADQVKETVLHDIKNFVPITAQQQMKTLPPGSKIGRVERGTAIREAPKYINPGGNKKEHAFINREWKQTHPRG